MKLLIHDYNNEEWNKVAANYEGWKVISDNGSIKPCAGCFGCWLKTPGQCVIKDGYDQMGRLIHEASEVLVISKYTYGGFSSFVKNVFDRSIGYLLPYFRMYKGEMHHKPRYREHKKISFIFRGVGLTDEDKAKARKYVEAVVTNLNTKVADIRFEECEATANVQAEVNEAQAKETVTSGKTVLLNCSLRGENANSKKLLDVVEGRLEGDVTGIDLVSYRNKTDELVDIMMSAEKLVFGMPLYVDGLPAQVVRLMELLEKRGISDKKVYVVANMGFFESKQLENLMSMVKDWCKACGIDYCGGTAVGAGGMMGSVIKYGSNGPGKIVYDSLVTLSEKIDKSEKASDIYTSTNKYPRFLYYIAANSGMKRGMKQNKG